MKQYLFLSFLLLLFSVSCSDQKEKTREADGDPAEILHPDWAGDALWDDGLAEVAQYEAERIVYGKPRRFEYTFILVKEDFNEEHNVKTDDYRRRDLFPVMKVNKFARIPTEKYPYHYLSSLFYKRDSPGTLHKMTVSSQEWCGNTFKLFEHTGDNYHYLYNSYWDGQGTGEMEMDGDIWFEDGLSYNLRALRFREGLTFRRMVLESQVNNKAGKPQQYNASFEVREDTSHSQQAWQVRVQLDDEKISTYWFAEEYPNMLLRQESHDGQKLSLKSAGRSAYWE